MLFFVNYSIEKDAENHINSLWCFSYLKHGREEIEEKLREKFPKEYIEKLLVCKDKKAAKKVSISFLKSLNPNYINTTDVICKGVESLLEENKKDIILKLENIYKNKFPFKKISVYLTTVSISPYNYEQRWFMSGRNQSIQGHLNTAIHELNHFMFYYYYPNLLEELGKEKYEELKEALVVFTNPKGNDKPAIRKLEGFFRRQKGTIPEILKKDDWKNCL